VLLANVFPQDARKTFHTRADGDVPFRECHRRECRRVVIHGDPGLLERKSNVGLGHAEDGDGSERMIFNQQVERERPSDPCSGFCDLGKGLALQRK